MGKLALSKGRFMALTAIAGEMFVTSKAARESCCCGGTPPYKNQTTADSEVLSHEFCRLNNERATLEGHNLAPSSRSTACRDEAGIHFSG
jgi:hypothetical protein